MPFSRLFGILILSGIVPILAAGLAGWPLYAFIIYNILLLALFAADMILTPGSGCLKVERVFDRKLSMGTSNEITVKVRNNSKYILDVEFRDEVPVFLNTRSPDVIIRSLQHHDCTGTYIVTPSKRGEFFFGNMHCRYTGVLKLCIKKGCFDLKSSCKVYPNLKDLRKYSLAAIKKSSLVQGTRKFKELGTGTEFESLREYNYGDDHRKINWSATARSGKMIVNTYEPEKNRQIVIMLDASRSMNSEINYIKKLDYAINSAFVLTDFVLRKGDNAGLLVFDNEVKRYIKCGKGMSHFQLIAENLYNVEENMVTADYEAALVYLSTIQKRRSLLCIFTDLLNTDDAMQMVSALKSVARNHIPLVITIKDPRVYKLAQSKVNETRDVFVKSAAAKIIEDRNRIISLIQRAGIACIDIPPDELSIEVINKYLSMKSMMQV